MKRKFGTKMLVALLTVAMMVGIVGCSKGKNNEDKTTEVISQEVDTAESKGAVETTEATATEGDSSSNEIVKVSMYPADANVSSGTVSGYKGEYFAKNGIELEIWAYSDVKTNALLASGDLPDIMYVSKDNLDTMIEAGMLLNLEEHLDKMPHVQSYEPMATALNYIREYRSAGKGELYGLPLSVGDNSTKEALADSTERNALKLRWDIYEEIGAPEITDIWGLIDVMEEMLKAHPTAEDGTPFYGTILNSGSDTKYWACMSMFYRWHGYMEEQLPYLLESNMVKGTNTSILNKDSLYYQGLKWYNEVYRRGLMDPDSINNDRATQKAKVDAGYAMVPSGYLPGWATNCYQYYIPGTSIYFNYTSAYGDPNKVIAINAKTENLDACLKILDMWCDPDAYLELINGTDGEFWYSEGENAYLTEETLEHLKINGAGGTPRTYSTGEEASLWNTSFCLNTGALTSYKDGNGNNRMLRTSTWKEAQEITSTNATFDKWKITTGFETWNDWLTSENAYYSSSSLDYVTNFCSQPDASMQLTIDAIKDIVVNASWNMVYAETESEFDSIWDEMIGDCEGIGAQEIIDWRLADINNAIAIRDSLTK